MRILTVRQPWAWAIFHGGKSVENRVRNIAGDYRGPIAIHVAMADADNAPESLWLRHADWYRGRSEKPKAQVTWRDMDRGFIIGVVDLVDVHDADTCWNEDQRRVARLRKTDRAAFDALPDSGAGGIVGRIRLCSPWALDDDFHHLVLANPRPIADPIPYKGALGLRALDEATAIRVWEAIA